MLSTILELSVGTLGVASTVLGALWWKSRRRLRSIAAGDFDTYHSVVRPEYMKKYTRLNDAADPRAFYRAMYRRHAGE